MNLHGILVVDKPRGMTSHDVVARIRRLLRERRVGHGGTLDPAAEGVLPVAVGAATRLIQQVQESRKRYLAHIVLGIETDTADIEGRIIAVSRVDAPDRAAVDAALARFLGTLVQVPPVYSAVKVGGEALHRRARRGEEVEVPARTVTIHQINLMAYRFPDLVVDVDCGSGTYIRSLARDLGRALGTSAYLHYLLRVSTGPFDLAQAWTLDALEAGLRPESWSLYALHPDVAMLDAGAIVLDEPLTRAWYHGQPVPAGQFQIEHDETVAVVRAYSWDGDWLGTGVMDAGTSQWRPRQVVGTSEARSH